MKLSTLAILAASVVAIGAFATVAFSHGGGGYGYDRGTMGGGAGWGHGSGKMGGGAGWGHGSGKMGGGAGWGHGSGMMGGGRGMMDPRALPFYQDLSAEQREQLDALHLSMAQQMLTERAKVQGLMLALRQQMHSFPIDQAGATSTWSEIQNSRNTIFGVMQGAMARVQQIIGETNWEMMQSLHGRNMPGARGMIPPAGMHGRAPTQ